MVTRTRVKTRDAAAKPKEPADPGEEIADPKTGELVPVNSEAARALIAQLDAEGYGADAGAGFEGQTSEDVSIPFIRILQPLSAEVQKEDGPKAGAFLNTATGETISGKDGFDFVPAFTKHTLVEWVPLDKGGGYVGEHELDSQIAQDVRANQPLGKYKHPSNGNDLVETFYVFGQALGADGNGFPAVMAFASTHIKSYKDWMFRATSIVVDLGNGRKQTKLPLFSHAYRFTSERVEKNGFTWYVPIIRFAGGMAEAARLSPRSDMYVSTRAIKEAVSAGRLRADASKLSQEEGGVDASPKKGDTDAEHAPY
ncbi:MAG: hypothetical protein KGR26_07945 [Cyanobacteria bacterium REEB65]|nr:hypothetical protein [Cyanobacteria bacterium REEB65]